MEQIISNFVPFNVDGFIETTLPSDIFNDLVTEANNIKFNNFENSKNYTKNNQYLLGAIEHEYSIPISDKLQKFINIIVKQYVNNTTYFRRDYSLSSIDSVWINFQKKHEFNPLHYHSGDLSFVTWLEIPYLLEDEQKLPHVINNAQLRNETTQFMFTYTSFYNLGLSHYTYWVDKNSVQKLILFNSRLYHSVYPFYTSNDYRISIAGNVKLIYE